MAEVFQKLLNMSIAAGWLILAVVVLRFVLKKAPKRFVLLLWAVVGLRLALPWSIESALSLIPSAATLPEGIMMERTPSLDTGIPALNNAINPGFAAAFAPEPAASANPLQVLLPIASALWLAVSVLMLLWALLSYMRLRHSVAEAVRVEGNVYECGRVASPFVLGLFRPRIYLPLGLSDGARVQVLAHEQAHIARGDHVIKPLGWLILSAHWYNPLVWLAYALFCRDIELACDERVIRSMPAAGRADYSQALLDLSRPRHSVGACPLAFGEASVKGRVKSVLSYKKPAFWLVVLAIVVCIGAAVCFLTDPKAKEDAGDADTVTIAAQLPKFIPDAADGIAESAPGPVLEAAQARVLELAAGLDVVDISAAEITTLELCAETPCPDGGTLYLYGLAASFYADGDWFTLLKSGLPTDYLLML
ncbi:MAG: M56 family metallopeptidase, partial [Oscillospiraceae bacterium]